MFSLKSFVHPLSPLHSFVYLLEIGFVLNATKVTKCGKSKILFMEKAQKHTCTNTVLSAEKTLKEEHILIKKFTVSPRLRVVILLCIEKIRCFVVE